jgi:hypothetical protein
MRNLFALLLLCVLTAMVTFAGNTCTTQHKLVQLGYGTDSGVPIVATVIVNTPIIEIAQIQKLPFVRELMYSAVMGRQVQYEFRINYPSRAVFTAELTINNIKEILGIRHYLASYDPGWQSVTKDLN